MAIKKETQYTMIMVAASLLIVACFLWMRISDAMDDLSVAGMFIGIMLVASTFFLYTGMSGKNGDERVRKIGMTAATWSWFISLVFLGLIYVFGYFSGRTINMAESFGTTVVVMVLSMVAINIILNYAGDVEWLWGA